MRVEIWSDVACPWCAVGKRRFEAALARFEYRDEVEVRWRSFELDPAAPAVLEGDYASRLAAKYGTSREQAQGMIDRMTEVGGSEGLAFDFDRIRPGNTFDAHRVLHLAADRGLQHEVKERFLRGYHEEGEAIGDRGVVARLAVDAGLDADDVDAVLDTGKYADDVRADEREAAELGIHGVPFFVIDRRYGLSGAQPAELLHRALEQAWSERAPFQLVGEDGHACADGSCAC